MSTTAKLVDPCFFADGDPHALWRELRTKGELSWTDEPDGPGFWSITRYCDGVRVFKDWESFSSAKGTTLEGNRWEDDPAGGSILALMDPPRHGDLRRALRPYFSARRLFELEQDARVHVRRQIERCTALGEFDFTKEIASYLPVHLSSRLMGISPMDWDRLFGLILSTLSADERERACADCELLGYLMELAEARRRQPGDDLLSAIVALPHEVLTEEEVVLNFAHVISASVTTMRLTLGGALHALIERPNAWQCLSGDPQRLTLAAEELIRWVSPALVMLRTATRPAEFRGQQVRAGERIAVWLPSLNRDAEIFRDPDTLLIDRNPNRHVGFGSGIHACIGQGVARVGLRAFLVELLAAWRDVQLTAAPRRLRSLILHGIDSLPVRVAPR